MIGRNTQDGNADPGLGPKRIGDRACRRQKLGLRILRNEQQRSLAFSTFYPSFYTLRSSIGPAFPTVSNSSWARNCSKWPTQPISWREEPSIFPMNSLPTTLSIQNHPALIPLLQIAAWSHGYMSRAASSYSSIRGGS